MPELDPVLQAVDLLLAPPSEVGTVEDRSEALAMILGNLVDWESVRPYYPTPSDKQKDAPVDWELFQRIDRHCGWTMP